MFINFEFLSTRKRVAVFAFAGDGAYEPASRLTHGAGGHAAH